MKLTDIYAKSMKEVLEDCEIISQKIHTNDDGEIVAIEMKYAPKKEMCKPVKNPFEGSGKMYL